MIIIGMGSENGFVEGSAKVWKRTAKDGVMSDDYHSDINSEGFEDWLKSVLPKLDPNSVLVFDNASYHSKKDENNAPKSTWKKERLQNWLKANGVPFEPKTLKPALWDLAKEKAAQNPQYRVDDIIKDAGHQVLRLPPYHCDLNPIGKYNIF